jgi:glutamate 5-kinase
VRGHFGPGDAVEFMTCRGPALGIGLVNYSVSEIQAIKGLKTSQIKRKLGSKPYDEVIHRDNLVITG